MMKSDTDLDLVFKNAVGKKVILNIEEPKSGVTKAEIDAAMQTVVDNNIFATTGGDIVEAVEGRLRTTFYWCAWKTSWQASQRSSGN